jgi:hypothetical protein
MNDVTMSIPGPWKWMVLWGQPGRRLRREVVEAFDADEALVEAARRHPEWERPSVALLASQDEVPWSQTSHDNPGHG